jgi:aspartyl/asparaginyl beta-hydroxylase (cupin superfamily)
VGVNNTRLLCHVPLIVPPGCWFRVGAETRPWREGEAFVFDDTIEHEASNPTDHLRVVMIFDLWHPDLDPLEQEAVAAIVAQESIAGDL